MSSAQPDLECNQFSVNRRTVLASLLVTPALVGLRGCAELTSESYRFRLIVEINTPEGIRTGSSVIEIWAAYDMPGSKNRLWRVRGEAVLVNLPNGRNLFALLKTRAIYNDMAGLSMETLDPLFNNDVVESAQRLASRENVRTEAIVQTENIPVLAVFGDINDRKSLQFIQPDEISEIFGPGYRLRQISAELTDDRVSNGIREILPPGPYGREDIFDSERRIELVQSNYFFEE